MAQKLISWNPIQNQNAELVQLTSQLSAAEGEKRDNSIQVEEIEVEIQHLGPKVTEKVCDCLHQSTEGVFQGRYDTH